MCGRLAVPSDRHSSSARKLRRRGALVVVARRGERQVHRHGRLGGARQQLVARLLPDHPRGRRVAREVGQLALALADLAQRAVAPAQGRELVRQLHARLAVGRRQPVEPGLEHGGARAEGLAHGVLVGRIAHLGLERLDARHQMPVVQLRHRPEPVLDRDQRDRDQDGDDQDDVLRDLGPGHRAHPAQEGADQDPGQPAEDADREVDADEARRDQADALDLRDQIDERTQDRRAGRERAHGRARKARAEEVGDGVARELAHIRRQQEGHEAEAAGPAHQVGERVVAGGVERAGQADEGRGRQPVGRRRHAVEGRGHAPPGHVVLDQVGGARQQPDHGIDGDRHEQEHVADPDAGPGGALDAPQQQHEGEEAQRVARIGADQPAGQHASRSASSSSRSCQPSARRGWSSATAPVSGSSAQAA